MAKEHFLEQHDPERKDFQIDRIILFSDAVFAIAITLLIIEIKAPEVHSRSLRDQLFQLSSLTPKFIGFIISFFVIGIYWRSHHRLYGFVNQYSDKLILLNFLFLFSIVLMPFSSAYYSENINYHLPLLFYNSNIIITGLLNYGITRYITHPQSGIVNHFPSTIFQELFIARSLTIPLIFGVGIIVSFISLPLSWLCPLLIWPALVILRRHYINKHYRVTEALKAKEAEETATAETTTIKE
ncbi:TMEM175 family protein [Mucilaginibacter sp. RS28]|uniref:TMEM175 family protein n=1 Tax=Mucilaginibacter straminoryzae TaxID=2932774 RepID=A0A9X1X670_9SPHI|nr:TMEM175 family protein [Mucilaginibacter straminoryzae]MCJ8211706.1 TMEM175 family protein [Mucilaginibacter straminoryzae]